MRSRIHFLLRNPSARQTVLNRRSRNPNPEEQKIITLCYSPWYRYLGSGLGYSRGQDLKGNGLPKRQNCGLCKPYNRLT
jgi:hypothetical protein